MIERRELRFIHTCIYQGRMWVRGDVVWATEWQAADLLAKGLCRLVCMVELSEEEEAIVAGCSEIELEVDDAGGTESIGDEACRAGIPGAAGSHPEEVPPSGDQCRWYTRVTSRQG